MKGGPFVLFLVALTVLVLAAWKFPNTTPFPLFTLLLAILLISLLPTLTFYAHTGYKVWPYLKAKKPRIDGMKRECTQLLDRHFTVKDYGEPCYYDRFNQRQPVLYVANHSICGSNIIHDFCLMRLPSKVRIIRYVTNTKFGAVINHIDFLFIPKDQPNRTEFLLEEARKSVQEGKSLLIFPEGATAHNKTNWRKLEPFRTGGFVLAKELGLSVIPLIISDGLNSSGLLKRGRIEMHYLDPLDPADYTIDQMKDECYDRMSSCLQQCLR